MIYEQDPEKCDTVWVFLEEVHSKQKEKQMEKSWCRSETDQHRILRALCTF